MTPPDIALRLGAVRARLAAASARAGRPEPRLVAVSKTQPPEAIRAAYAAGQRLFGENYAQELVAKADALVDLPDLEWHFIGHLQRNKARLVVPRISTIHSVDSLALVHELARRAEGRAARPLRVLVELNLAGEASKSGAPAAALAELGAAIEGAPALELAGLMTLPPASDDADVARRTFAELVRVRDAHGGAARWPELSMGMSHDLEAAVEAGATLVRIGTAIFGARS